MRRGLDKYWQVLVWQFGWAWRKNTLRVILLAAAGGGSILLQGAILGSLFHLVNGLQGEVSFELAGMTWNWRMNDPYVLIGMMVGFGIVLTAAGVAWLIFNRLVNALAVRFERALLRKLIERYLRGAPLANPHWPGSEVGIIRLARGGARLSGRSLRVLLTSVLDGIRAILFLGVCLYLNVIPTFLVIVLLIPIGIGQLFLNRRIHQNEAVFEESQAQAGDVIKNAVNSYPSGNVSSPDRTIVAQGVMDDPSVNQAQRSYLYRLNAAAHAEMLGHIGLTLALIGALGWLIHGYLNGEVEIAAIAIFLLAMRFFLQATKSLIISCAVFTRHFGRVREVYEALGYDRKSLSSTGNDI